MDINVIDFSQFNERFERLSSRLPASDNTEEHESDGLYFRFHLPAGEVNDVILIYHGGGVNADAGYTIPARQISARGAVCVCLVDIRGHGRSLGPKGDVTSPQQIWQDVDTVFDAVARRFPGVRIHLLGHSSGGGMLINYFTCHAPRNKADSLILLAPELGPFAPAHIIRTGATPFSSVNRLPFIVNALTQGKLCGRRSAVKLHFPEEVLTARPDFARAYSVNMANALTPRQPARQIAALPLPVTVLLPECDELANPQQVAAFVEGCANQNITVRQIKNSNHLESVFDASDAICHHLCSVNTRADPQER
ncbi:alpha/beta hydrolase [Pantoea sp. NSTU24]|uniref:alpha/beta hydrolase n=1 Tax=Pantoea sp. NSTU24 TaxID=3391144 RepID=UPI003D06065B